MQKAFRLFQDAVESGNTMAKYYLGQCYYDGKGVEKNINKAVNLFQEAAELGDESAKNALGVCYMYGKGVEKNLQKAFRLFQDAAESNDAQANANLGLCYQFGDGVEKDLYKALVSFRKAIELGNKTHEKKLNTIQFALNLLEENDCTNDMDREWAERQIVSLSPENWRTFPLNIGSWEKPSLKETIQILTDFHRGLRTTEQLEQLDNTQCVRIRMTSLSFYPGLSLVEVELLSLKNGTSLFTHALRNSNGVTPLNCNSDIIYALNLKFLSFEAEQSPEEYLTFLCEFSHSDDGPFHIISNLNDPKLILKPDKSLSEQIKQYIRPVRHVNGTMKTDGWQQLDAFIIYGNSLFYAGYKLFANGQVDMESECMIVENLPIIRFQYNSIFCYQSSDK